MKPESATSRDRNVVQLCALLVDLIADLVKAIKEGADESKLEGSARRRKEILKGIWLRTGS